jgi:acetyltransferase-like isoleucine patch superfamily enzyme
MTWLRSVYERWKHVSLRRYRRQVRVPASTRLLGHFAMRFLTPPDDRVYVTIGERCMLNATITFESVDGAVHIGERCYIGHGTNIISRARVSIGSDVTMAWDITLYDHNSHSFDWQQRAKVVEHFHRHYGSADCFQALDWDGVASAPIVIADKVWIGFGAVVLKGVTIGEGAVVAARSVVARDVEPYTVVGGNPAVLIRRLQSSTSESAEHVSS